MSGGSSPVDLGVVLMEGLRMMRQLRHCTCCQKTKALMATADRNECVNFTIVCREPWTCCRQRARRGDRSDLMIHPAGGGGGRTFSQGCHGVAASRLQRLHHHALPLAV